MGGISKWTLRMLNAQLPDDWGIVLVSDRIIGDRDVFGDNRKYKIKNEIKRWSGVWYNLFKVIRRNDVVLAHACPIATIPSMLVNIISGLIVRVCGKRFLIHFRCTVPNLIKNKKQRLILKVLCEISNHIIVLNTQSKLYLTEVCKRPISIIPNFVDSNEIESRKKIIASKISTILYVGGVIPEKGCDDIIKIAQKLPDIEFRLVGDASSVIKELAQRVPNVILTGVKTGTELKAEFLNADVFLFLSRYSGEGFSNSLTEAMAYGLPCIVTDWAANADQIDQERGGYVVKEDIVSDTILAIKRMRNPMIREEQSIYNTKKSRLEYSAQSIIRKYVSCYESMII